MKSGIVILLGLGVLMVLTVVGIGWVIYNVANDVVKVVTR